MAVGLKFDYPPLLAPGRHLMSLTQIEARFVTPFTGEALTARRDLFLKFEAFLQEFLVAGIPCEMWLNGSFLTEKPLPEDLDVAVMLDHNVTRGLTTEQKLLIAKSETSPWDGMDCFLFVRKPKSDSLYGDELADPAAHWHEQWGRERHIKTNSLRRTIPFRGQ